jgi:hypothetical protein
MTTLAAGWPNRNAISLGFFPLSFVVLALFATGHDEDDVPQAGSPA